MDNETDMVFVASTQIVSTPGQFFYCYFKDICVAFGRVDKYHVWKYASLTHLFGGEPSHVRTVDVHQLVPNLKPPISVFPYIEINFSFSHK